MQNDSLVARVLQNSIKIVTVAENRSRRSLLSRCRRTTKCYASALPLQVWRTKSEGNFRKLPFRDLQYRFTLPDYFVLLEIMEREAPQHVVRLPVTPERLDVLRAHLVLLALRDEQVVN